MALPATDAFTNTTNTHLSDHSASWTNNTGEIEIHDNTARGDNNNANSLYHWSGDTFDGDHYSEATCAIISASGGNRGGVACRIPSTAFTCYAFPGNSVNSTLYKYVAGSETTLESGGAAFTISDLIYIEASGTTIDAKINSVSEWGGTTDSSLSGGSAGINIRDNHINVRLDDWTGDNLGAGPAGTILPQVMHHYYEGPA